MNMAVDLVRVRRDHNSATILDPNTQNCLVSASFLGFDQN